MEMKIDINDDFQEEKKEEDATICIKESCPTCDAISICCGDDFVKRLEKKS